MEKMKKCVLCGYHNDPEYTQCARCLVQLPAAEQMNAVTDNSSNDSNTAGSDPAVDNAGTSGKTK